MLQLRSEYRAIEKLRENIKSNFSLITKKEIDCHHTI